MLCTEGSKKRWGGGLRAQFFRHPIGDYRHLLKISLKKTRHPLEEILKPPLYENTIIKKKFGGYEDIIIYKKKLFMKIIL